MTFVPPTHQDLLDSQVAMLATMGPDGYPQVTALWFLFDDDGIIKLSLNTTGQKVKNLRAHPECTFFILDTANPYRTLEVRARAVIAADQDLAFARKLGMKYDGWIPQDPPGESRVVVSLQPIKVNTCSSWYPHSQRHEQDWGITSAIGGTQLESVLKFRAGAFRLPFGQA